MKSKFPVETLRSAPDTLRLVSVLPVREADIVKLPMSDFICPASAMFLVAVENVRFSVGNVV